MHTHTRQGTTQVSWYQKGKTNLDFTEARDSERKWISWATCVCTPLQTDNHASTPPLVFTGRMPFLVPNQQRQSTEGLESTCMLHKQPFVLIPNILFWNKQVEGKYIEHIEQLATPG